MRNTLMPTTKGFGSLIDQFFNMSIGDMVGSDFTHHMPAVNIKNQDKNFIIEIAAPGLKKEDFNVEIDGDQLIISAEKSNKEESTTHGYTRREFNYNKFSRRFTIPDEVDKDSIQAAYKDGILNLTIDKSEQAIKHAPRRIEIV